jgi:flagellin
MPITIGSNIVSLNVQRQLGRTSDSLSTIYERLASGQRINRASDDAAGLAISSSLRTNARVFGQGIRNVNDGLSATNIIDGALGQLTEITTRLRELAEQSANGTYSSKQRENMDQEAQQMRKEFNRIVEGTTFNGIALLANGTDDLLIQAGQNSTEFALYVDAGATDVSKDNTGSFSTVSGTYASDRLSLLVDLNNDGNLDRVHRHNGASSNLNINLGNGDGSFRATMTNTSGSALTTNITMVSGDFNGDGFIDITTNNATVGQEIFFGNGDGTFRAAITSPSVNIITGTGDFNGDGKDDIISSGQTIMLSDGSGNFTTSHNMSAAGLFVWYGYTPALDLNGDNILDIISKGNTSTIYVAYGNGNGTFRNITSYSTGAVVFDANDSVLMRDVNGDEILDIISSENAGVVTLFGNSNGTFSGPVRSAITTGTIAVGDLNSDGRADIIETTAASGAIFFGNGDGSFYATGLTIGFNPIGGAVNIGDLNKDGAMDLSGFSIALGNTKASSKLQTFSLLTTPEARSSLGILENVASRLSLARSRLGAVQSRLGVATQVLSTQQQGFLAANSRIVDTDIAEESAALTSKKIAQQAASAVLGQANLMPQFALRLLSGS